LKARGLRHCSPSWPCRQRRRQQHSSTRSPSRGYQRRRRRRRRNRQSGKMEACRRRRRARVGRVPRARAARSGVVLHSAAGSTRRQLPARRNTPRIWVPCLLRSNTPAAGFCAVWLWDSSLPPSCPPCCLACPRSASLQCAIWFRASWLFWFCLRVSCGCMLRHPANPLGDS